MFTSLEFCKNRVLVACSCREERKNDDDGDDDDGVDSDDDDNGDYDDDGDGDHGDDGGDDDDKAKIIRILMCRALFKVHHAYELT